MNLEFCFVSLSISWRGGLRLGVLAPWRDHPDYLSKKSLTQSRKAAKICNVIDCFLSTISHDKV